MFKFKKIAGVVSAVAVTSVLTAQSAFAAIDTAPLDTALTDVGTVGAAAFAIIVAAAAFKYVRRAL
jgi:hypothetical protein